MVLLGCSAWLLGCCLVVMGVFSVLLVHAVFSGLEVVANVILMSFYAPVVKVF